MKIYEERNKIVVPLMQRIADIEKDRTSSDDPGLYEDEEHHILLQIDEEERKLPKLNDLIEMNAQKADYVLTEIQSGVVTKVKATQIQKDDYIYESLKFFNFGDYFIKIVRTMLTGRTCTVMIDG